MNKFYLVFFAFVFILAISVSYFPSLGRQTVEASATASPSSSASSTILLEANSGRVLFSKNADTKRAMASTTKIVTALTVIENVKDLNKICTIPKAAVGIEGTSIYLKEGEKLTYKDLLFGLLLQSGNDAAVALAILTAGNEKEFVRLMNETAKKYGLENSHLQNPHGLDHTEHYTTASDLAKITKIALDNDMFLEICSKKSVFIPSQNGQERNLRNKNKLLFTLPGCIGVKTGYTSKAGRCLVSACERDGMRLVCVTLNCGPMFEESANLFEWAFSTFKMRELIKPNKICKNVTIQNGAMPYVKTYTNRGFCYPLSDTEYLRVDFKYELPDAIKAPVKKQEKIGELKIYFDGDLLFEENIYTMEDVNIFQTTGFLKKIIHGWLD